MNRKIAEEILKSKFNINGFYDEQWLTINKVLQGEKVLLIEKTGFGKSLCFQFPAVVFEGTTVIFSPLIALMRDQVKKLQSLGIDARCINSEQSVEENFDVLNSAKSGKVKILYIAPERQENSEWLEAVREIKLSMVVIDEAHCISVWGHDFRPAFKRIINLVKLLPKGLPVLATTATATTRVENDIANQIGTEVTVIRGNLMRDNFKLFVLQVNSEDEKLIWLGKNISKFPGSGIIYTGTRVDTELYSKWLNFIGVSSIGYNAGLDSELRIEIENGLLSNKWKCIISTNALGMGIDKPDIRFIIHTQMPQSPIHYYQEIGRAGRDGLPTYVILLYDPIDIKLPLNFIDTARPSIKSYEKVIDIIESELLGERELMKAANLTQTQIRVIKSDLIDQGIIREVMMGRNKKYEYIHNSKPLNTEFFKQLRDLKLKELDSMIEYAETKSSRMEFLCNYLGDKSSNQYVNCDNTTEKTLKVHITDEWDERLQDFKNNNFPELKVETKGSNIINGVAGSFYGSSNVGNSIHDSKYENMGDFPNFLLNLTVQAYYNKFTDYSFDLMLYIPPTKSGNLVRNFAEKLAKALNIQLSHGLIKSRTTKEQKIFDNWVLKMENVKGAFSFTNEINLEGKKVLLFDDIFDSGATIKEAGKYLTSLGAEKIAPIVIAKTVGGDLK